MDQFAAMRAFVKVVETNGFSEAAAVADGSILDTRQVNALEDMLNTQLLNRSTRSISLTHQGRKYSSSSYPPKVESANQCVAEQEEVRGLLKVSMPVAFGRLHIAPIVNDFLLNTQKSGWI